MSVRDADIAADQGHLLIRAAGRWGAEVAGGGHPRGLFAAHLPVSRPRGAQAGHESPNNQEDTVPQLRGQAEVAQTAQRITGI